jgi:hypothetical protein
VPETTVDAAPLALVLAFTLVAVEAVEAGRETVEEVREFDAFLSVSVCEEKGGLTDAEADDAAGSEEIAAKIEALKVPTISSRLLISNLSQRR